MKLNGILDTLIQAFISIKRFAFLLLFLIIALSTATAQFCLENTFIDIDPGTSSSAPNYLTAAGDKLFYSARGPLGEELYIYDCTNETNTVIDIYPGINSSFGSVNNSNPGDFVVINNKVLYPATGDQGRELYIYDLITNTNTLIDVHAGTRGSSPSNFIVAGNKLFFTAANTTVGGELFIYDCMTNTLNVVDINPGTSGSLPQYLTLGAQKIFLSAQRGNGSELFIYDIETQSITEVDVFPGSTGSIPTDFFITGDKVFYSANGPNGNELFIYNATTGTNTEIDINPGSNPSFPRAFTRIGNKVFYNALGSNGDELYIYDCSNNSNTLMDLNPGAAGSRPNYLTAIGDKLFYTANAGNGTELFIYDTQNGSNTEIDINPGTNSSSPQPLKAVGNQLFYSATGSSGRELYIYDCTNKTNTLIDINPTGGANPSNFVLIDNLFYYRADGGTGTELYIYDTQNKTNTLVELTAGTDGSDPTGFTLINNKLFYEASGSAGYELYISEFIHPITITGGPVEVCLGSPLTINIDAVGGTPSNLAYSWTGPNGFTSSSEDPMVSTMATNDLAGTYTVTVTNTKGVGGACSTTKNFEVIVNDCLTEMSFSLRDPCNCSNPNNIKKDDRVILFADKLRIDASMYPAGTLPSVTAVDVNLLTASGTPYTTTTATNAIVNLGGGIFELPFYTKPDMPSTLTVSVVGDSQVFTTDSCMPCPDPIPTMSQWGLLIFGLLILNLAVLFINQLGRGVSHFE